MVMFAISLSAFSLELSNALLHLRGLLSGGLPIQKSRVIGTWRCWRYWRAIVADPRWRRRTTAKGHGGRPGRGSVSYAAIVVTALTFDPTAVPIACRSAGS
jgi:hypothetical protein